MQETPPDAPAPLPESNEVPAPESAVAAPDAVVASAAAPAVPFVAAPAVAAPTDAAPAAAAPADTAPTAAAPQPTPAESAQRLKALFPALFGGAVKPLKLRIQVDIQERAPGQFTKQALSAFFRRHTGSTSYLLAVARSPHRFDLDGQPAGEVTEEHRKAAQDELTRRRSNQDSRRELEEQQRRNRAGLLHDFQITTLTKANFCALKGVAVDELDGLLEIARAEAEERARQMPARGPQGFGQQRPGDARAGDSRGGNQHPPQQRPAHRREDPDRAQRPRPPGGGQGPRRPR